jgi:hypothetical protein
MKIKQKNEHLRVHMFLLHKGSESATSRVARLRRQLGEKYFHYFVFNIVDCGLSRLRARRHALAQTIGNARGLDINSLMIAEAHTQDLQFHRHQQRDDPNSARGLDNNFASDRGYNSMTTTQLRYRRLRPRRLRRTRQKLSFPLSEVDYYLLLPHLTLGGSAMKNHLAYH